MHVPRINALLSLCNRNANLSHCKLKRFLLEIQELVKLMIFLALSRLSLSEAGLSEDSSLQVSGSQRYHDYLYSLVLLPGFALRHQKFYPL